MRAAWLLIVVLVALLEMSASSPASGGAPSASAARKKRRAVSSSSRPRPVEPEPEPEEESEEPEVDEWAEEEEEEAVEAAAPPPPPLKKKKGTKKRRRTAPPPPPPSLLDTFSSGFSRLRHSAQSQYDGMKETWVAREEVRRVEIARERARSAVRMRQLREEMAALQAQAEAEDGEMADEADGAGGPLTLSERGAILGSVLLSPAGVPGVVVGGAFGGAAGYVTERIEQARAYIAGAYNERVETDRLNAAQMSSTHDELKALDEVTVSADDADEAAALTQAMVAFLAQPANTKCADCAAPFHAHNDAWASVNLGVLVCVNCAAVHRSMGVGVSRMKSVVFDRWDAPMAQTLLEGGNARARETYLARLPRGYAEPPPDADAERRAAFIRSKYVRLKWAAPALREARRAEIAQRRAHAASAAAAPRSSGPMPSLSSEHA